MVARLPARPGRAGRVPPGHGTLGTMSTDAHVAVVRRIFGDAWNRAEFEGVADAIDDGAVFNHRGASWVTGFAELRHLVTAWRRAFPDLHFTIDDLVAEGDRVAARLTFTGTHQGEWKGLAATHRRIRVDEMMFFRFADGRVVEIWEVDDEHALWEQLRPDGATA